MATRYAVKVDGETRATFADDGAAMEYIIDNGLLGPRVPDRIIEGFNTISFEANGATIEPIEDSET